MGHTHYPLEGMPGRHVYNPCSVGQPRDGNPMPSWGIFATETRQFILMRSEYNNIAVMEELVSLNWDKRSVEGLS